MSVDRREFLKFSGGALGLTALAAACGKLDAFGVRSQAATLPAGTPILVMIELNGGNDILNTHVPHNVPGVTSVYRADRPNLAIRNVTSTRPYAAPPAGTYLPPALDLDGQYGFHGNLVWLANRWHDKQDVAIVQGVGEDVAKEMSHFAAMAYRWAAAFTGPNLASGWLGRFNDAQHPGEPVASIAVNGPNQSLVGMSTAPVVVNNVTSFNWMVASNTPSRPQFLTDLQGFGAGLPAALNKAAAASAAISRTQSAISAIAGTAQPAMNTGVSAGSLAYQLSQVAMMILGGLPCQTYVASLGGFDTHGGQAYNHFVVLGELDRALQRFFSYIDASPRAADVFVLITSEFGRQVKENGGGGTDHGRASSAILVGGGVRGGLYGQMPRLDVRDHDALIPTVDFRAAFGTVLRRLGGPGMATAVLGLDGSGNEFPDLGFFKAAGGGVVDMAAPAADMKAPAPEDLQSTPPPDMNGVFRDDRGRICICT
jgi:uncharacterized protein (DUF1501 family)